MDHVELRYDILKLIDDHWADELGEESAETVKGLVMQFTGKKLLVLHLLFVGGLNQKTIAEEVGLSEAAVSKMINHGKDFSRLRSYLLFRSDGKYDEKGARKGRGKGAARAGGYASHFPVMSPGELATQWGLAKDVIYEQNDEDYTDGNVPGTGYDTAYNDTRRGFVVTLVGWSRRSSDPGRTNEPLAVFEQKYKSGDKIAEEAMKKRWAEQRKIEAEERKKQKNSPEEG